MNPKDPQAELTMYDCLFWLLWQVTDRSMIDLTADTRVIRLVEKTEAALDKLFQPHHQELLTELSGEAESTFAYSDCGGVHPECSKRCVGHPRIVKSAIPVSVIERYREVL